MRALAVTLLALTGCGSSPTRDPFSARGIEGAFVLLDTESGAIEEVNATLAARRFVPCSTFKIPNTLIGLETGVIPGADFALEWDGVKRSIEAWNRDHDLASAMKFSVVWFYQEVARRIGAARMADHVRRFDYGNADTSGVIDRFWLDGPLAISPREQVDFLRRLHAGELPVKAEHVELVLRLIELERGDGWLLRGKTGLGEMDGRAVGWLVGSVERGGRRWVYALLVLGKTTEQIMPMRRPLVEELLRARGAHPPT